MQSLTQRRCTPLLFTSYCPPKTGTKIECPEIDKKYNPEKRTSSLVPRTDGQTTTTPFSGAWRKIQKTTIEHPVTTGFCGGTEKLAARGDASKRFDLTELKSIPQRKEPPSFGRVVAMEIPPAHSKTVCQMHLRRKHFFASAGDQYREGSE